jgi:hypothetical protein
METQTAVQLFDLVEQGKFKIECLNFEEGATDTPAIRINWDETEPALEWWTNKTTEEKEIFMYKALAHSPYSLDPDKDDEEDRAFEENL